MDFMFSNPTMLDDLDYLYKSDTARKLMFYYQVHLQLLTVLIFVKMIFLKKINVEKFLFLVISACKNQ